MRWYASAPSNIALIKYMGKTDAQTNLPSNASLSYTLRHLNTHVEVEPKSAAAGDGDLWEPLRLKTLNEKITELSEKGRQRYLRHLQRIKDHFNYRGSFIVRSVNDFPADCGLASSASSFAALTLCTYRALKELTALNPEEYDETHLMEEAPQMSELSRQGSGSSCRSFFGPWAIWDEEGARKVDLPYGDLIHLAVIADGERKEVSSSAAHLQVTSSALFQGRPERANRRLRDLVGSLQEKDWSQCFEICWAEFWDMHALFETSRPSFGYMNAQSMRVIESVRRLWKKGDGPICTMDAGPNIHLLFRQDQKSMAAEYIRSLAADTVTGDLNIYTSLR